MVCIEQHIGLQPGKFDHRKVIGHVKPVEQHEIEAPRMQAGNEVFLGPFLQAQARLGVEGLKLRNELWRIDGREGRETANGQFAFHQLACIGDVPLEVDAMGNQAACLVEETQALRRRQNPLRMVADEELQAQLGLELLQGS